MRRDIPWQVSTDGDFVVPVEVADVVANQTDWREELFASERRSSSGVARLRCFSL
jgi:hypothetical protein